MCIRHDLDESRAVVAKRFIECRSELLGLVDTNLESAAQFRIRGETRIVERGLPQVLAPFAVGMRR